MWGIVNFVSSCLDKKLITVMWGIVKTHIKKNLYPVAIKFSTDTSKNLIAHYSHVTIVCMHTGISW